MQLEDKIEVDNNGSENIIWFNEISDCKFHTRLANIEVEFDLESGGLTCAAIQAEDVFLCENGQCPHDGDPDESDCYSKCPYKYSREGFDWTHFIGASGDDNLLDTVIEFRRIVREGTDGLGHRKKWPRLVQLIADSDWIAGGWRLSVNGDLLRIKDADNDARSPDICVASVPAN